MATANPIPLIPTSIGSCKIESGDHWTTPIDAFQQDFSSLLRVFYSYKVNSIYMRLCFVLKIIMQCTNNDKQTKTFHVEYFFCNSYLIRTLVNSTFKKWRIEIICISAVKNVNVNNYDDISISTVYHVLTYLHGPIHLFLILTSVGNGNKLQLLLLLSLRWLHPYAKQYTMFPEMLLRDLHGILTALRKRVRSFICKKLNPLNPKMFCVKFG